MIVPIASSLALPVDFSSVKGIFGKGVSERQGGGIPTLLAVSLLLKGILGKGVKTAGKGVMRARRGYNNMDPMDKEF